MAGLNNNALNGTIINVTGVAAGLAQQTGLLSQLEGQPSRVQFIKPGLGTVLAFDACINEAHQASAQPTMFPVEDGSVVSDHVVLNPITLSLTGVISDTPLPETLKDTLTQTLGAAATTLLPPLGVTVASTAFAIYQTGQQDTKRSKTAYSILMALMRGNPNASPPTPPVPITVLTKYGRYSDMIITNLTFPVDASTDGQLVVTVDLMHMVRVAPQVVNLASLSNAALAAERIDAGAQDADGNEIVEAAKAGFKSTYDPIASIGDRLLGTVRP